MLLHFKYLLNVYTINIEQVETWFINADSFKWFVYISAQEDN